MERVDELGDVADAVLEQVADATGTVGEQLGRVAALDILAEHEDRRPGDPAAELDRRAQPLVTLGRRHPDVDHRDVRAELSTAATNASPSLPMPRLVPSSMSRASPSRMKRESSAIADSKR